MTDNSPVTVTVSIGPKNAIQKILQKWKLLPTKRKFVIQDQVISSCIRISNLIIGIDSTNLTTVEDILKVVDQHKEVFTKIIAHSIYNQQGVPSRRLVSFLSRNLSHYDAAQILHAVLAKMGLPDMMQCFYAVKGINIIPPIVDETLAELP